MHNSNSHCESLIKFKQQYFAIGGVPCPAFNNDIVYFNKKGWNHLLRKQGILRNPKDQLRRLRLISTAEFIIRTSRIWHKYKKMDNNSEFWSFISNLPNARITVIIKRDFNQKYFLSVMN